MPLPVASPTPRPLRIGLVSGGRAPADPAARWELGISYDPLYDHLGNEFPEITSGEESGIQDLGELDPGTLEKAIPDGQENNEWLPYTIWLGEKCGTMSNLRRSFFDPRVRDQLDAQTSHRLERSFSRGELEVSATEAYSFADLGLPNRPLYSADAVELNGSVPVGVVEGIEQIVGAMADELGAVRGMIHVPHVLLPYLDFYGQIIRNPSDGRFISLRSHDHTVIAGTGYDGLAPDGTDDTDAGIYWIYGTSDVEVRTSEMSAVAAEEEDIVRTRENQIEYRIERLALASWDLSCHVAIPVAAIDPGPEITS